MLPNKWLFYNDVSSCQDCPTLQLTLESTFLTWLVRADGMVKLPGSKTSVSAHSQLSDHCICILLPHCCLVWHIYPTQLNWEYTPSLFGYSLQTADHLYPSTAQCNWDIEQLTTKRADVAFIWITYDVAFIWSSECDCILLNIDM